MSLLAKLTLGDNKPFLVTDCKIKTTRHYTAQWPDKSPRCEEIELTIIAPEEHTLFLNKWYIDQDLQSGNIKIDMSNQSNDDHPIRTIKFEEAQCFSLEEFYDIKVTYRHLFIIKIMAAKMTIDEVTFSNNFR